MTSNTYKASGVNREKKSKTKVIDFRSKLRAVQGGLEPSDWKPMQVIGPGVKEIRIHVLGEWRVIYVAKLRDVVYVLHAFQKKTRKTSRHDIDLARQRYRQIGGDL